jgi:HSP20 family molecular chaperone IbpA
MKDLSVWKNEQFKQLRAEMDRLFRDFTRDFGPTVFDEMAGEVPSVDISETADAVVINMEFPEFDPADIEIAVSAESIIIEGRKKERRVGSGQRVESGRHFSSRLKLPCRILPEKSEAVYGKNRLQIVLPKCRAAVFRKIPIHHIEK